MARTLLTIACYFFALNCLKCKAYLSSRLCGITPEIQANPPEYPLVGNKSSTRNQFHEGQSRNVLAGKLTSPSLPILQIRLR